MFTKFNGDTHAYIPYFAELLVIPSKASISPFFSARLGSAIYSYKTVYTTTGAGLFMEFKAGIAGGKGRTKFICSGGYTNARFNYSSSVGQDINKKNIIEGFVLSMGVKI